DLSDRLVVGLDLLGDRGVRRLGLRFENLGDQFALLFRGEMAAVDVGTKDIGVRVNANRTLNPPIVGIDSYVVGKYLCDSPVRRSLPSAHQFKLDPDQLHGIEPVTTVKQHLVVYNDR